MVIFPYMMTPFVVGRESSVRALEEALNGDRKIFLPRNTMRRSMSPSEGNLPGRVDLQHCAEREDADGNIKVLVEE